VKDASMTRSRLIAAAVLALAGAAAAVPFAGAQDAKGDDALRAALAESKATGKGLTFYIRGATVPGLVVSVGDKFVTAKNQSGLVVVRIDSIDAVAGPITGKP
jgi:hypothetical protein